MSGSEIRCTYTDPAINERLQRLAPGSGAFSRHFNQVEESFLRLQGEFAVPQLPIHHDVRAVRPQPEYLRSLSELVDQLAALAPQVFQGLSYLFDPADTLRPSFFKLHACGESRFLYLLRLDLTHRPQTHRAVVKGDNDRTTAYAGRDLYMESFLVPLREAPPQTPPRFVVDETISDTWVTQTGRGYFVQGIWMDNDLTRFFSKLLLPPGLRMHPYYPYLCRYRTVCLAPVELDEAGRERLLPRLREALEMLRPLMPRVEQSLRGKSFSESDPLYRRLKERVPARSYKPWRGLKVEAYLDGNGMKEYRVECAPA